MIAEDRHEAEATHEVERTLEPARHENLRVVDFIELDSSEGAANERHGEPGEEGILRLNHRERGPHSNRC